MKARSLNTLVIVAVLVSGGHAPAAGEIAPQFDHDHVASELFWRELHPAGGWTLLCGEHFGADQRTGAGASVGIDHAYQVAAMVKALGCGDRAQCRARLGARFARMESDLHNLYPEPLELVTYRINRVYGNVAGEDWRFDNCDIEWRNGVLEPRPLARGNIARAVLYMRATYELPLDDATLELMKAWNREDPPSKQELERNAAIERIQGRRNAFIDKPELVENLRNLRR
jgi:deoxyribonuclease-1